MMKLIAITLATLLTAPFSQFVISTTHYSWNHPMRSSILLHSKRSEIGALITLHADPIPTNLPQTLIDPDLLSPSNKTHSRIPNKSRGKALNQDQPAQEKLEENFNWDTPKKKMPTKLELQERANHQVEPQQAAKQMTQHPKATMKVIATNKRAQEARKAQPVPQCQRMEMMEFLPSFLEASIFPTYRALQAEQAPLSTIMIR
mmetsp:Transcript_7046/g.6300  ORF Transcript_7046/g.6300 Transcript_7046/m.6300 type:complete len:203 (+) Transcript_7046:880-1488(+)